MAKKPKYKRPGQPTLYKPEYCQALIDHLRNGDSYTTFAAFCDVCLDTLYHWEQAHPEFLEAKKKGWAHYQKYWEDAGKTGLYNETIKDGDGMTVTRSINAAVWIYNMKCRFRKEWADHKDITADVTTTSSKEDEEVKELVEWYRKLKDLK
jgi:hypothetical protein